MTIILREMMLDVLQVVSRVVQCPLDVMQLLLSLTCCVKLVLHTIKVISMLQLFQNVVVGLVYSKNPISALLQGRTFGSGCVWVKLV